MNKYIPGPWTFEDHGLHGCDVLAIVPGWSEHPVRIASVVPFETRRANAALIAAAPELLGALKAAKEFIENLQAPDPEWDRVLDVCVAAIAKAEGRS